MNVRQLSSLEAGLSRYCRVALATHRRPPVATFSKEAMFYGPIRCEVVPVKGVSRTRSRLITHHILFIGRAMRRGKNKARYLRLGSGRVIQSISYRAAAVEWSWKHVQVRVQQQERSTSMPATRPSKMQQGNWKPRLDTLNIT